MDSCVATVTVLAMQVPALAAGPSTVALTLHRGDDAADCFDATGLERAVEDCLGRRVFGPPATADVAIDGNIGPRPGGTGWSATFAMKGGDGTVLGHRDLTTDALSCRALDEPIALVLALMIDLPRPTITLRIPARPAEARGRGVEIWLGVSALSSVGLLPGASYGAEATLRIDPPRFPALEIAAATWADARADTTRKAGAVLSARSITLAVCPIDRRGRRLALVTVCPAVQGGTLEALGFGFDEILEQEHVFMAGGATGSAVIRMHRSAGLRLGLSAFVPFTRHEYHYVAEDGSVRSLHQLSPAYVTFAAGLAVGIE